MADLLGYIPASYQLPEVHFHDQVECTNVVLLEIMWIMVERTNVVESTELIKAPITIVESSHVYLRRCALSALLDHSLRACGQSRLRAIHE